LKSRLARVALFLLTIVMTSAYADDQSVTVLIHHEVTTNELTSAQLRRIFSMRQTVWPNGMSIAVFVLPTENPAHQVFCKEILKMFPYQVERIWNKLVYSGMGVKPIEVESEQQMLQKIKDTPGAIGYLPESNDFEHAQQISIKGD
jgi:ABC-type phosphate transport system substrate-binding protein